MVQNALGSTPAGPFALELSDQGLLALAHRHSAQGQFDQNVSDLIITFSKSIEQVEDGWSILSILDWFVLEVA